MLMSKRNIIDSIKINVIDWNNKYPIDRWYRKKYNIPFGSESHRNSNFFDMVFEFEEDKLFKKSQKEEPNEDFINNSSGTSQEEIDKDFDEIDM